LEHIEHIKSKKYENCPTRTLLKEWQHTPNATVENLLKILEKINNFTAKKIVEECLHQWQQRSESTKVNTSPTK